MEGRNNSTRPEWTSPSLRGSGLKFQLSCLLFSQTFVSLFTREWIEISAVNSGGSIRACVHSKKVV